MKVALYSRHIDPSDRPAFDYLCAELQRAGVDYQTVREGDCIDSYDYLFSIGGDGTLLSSVQFLTYSGNPMPPVLGINFGHLGFLTTVGKENLATLVSDLLAGRFTLEKRTVLKIQINGGAPTKEGRGEAYVLNEAFLHRHENSSMLRTEVYVNDLYVATYAGDGVIVASPTGSTAYSLSCGGPILTPDCGCFVITPIGAHTLTLRPIIVPDTTRITLKIQNNSEFTLGTDSRRHTLHGSTTIELSRAPFSIRLIRMNTQNFFSAIRDKLMWGTEVRP
jgi:NAD+ kinase